MQSIRTRRAVLGAAVNDPAQLADADGAVAVALEHGADFVFDSVFVAGAFIGGYASASVPQ